jgi:hypothetical protein
LLGTTAKDAIGINHKVAERLSGADFDGDTVLVIPNNRGAVKNTPALKDLQGFDPLTYKLPKDSPIPRMTSEKKGYEMGQISNLITDMSLQGADTEKLARAIKHSMVVIDAEKHELDYQQSAKDNGILSLKEEYQGGKRGGASTLISKANAPFYVNERVPRPASKGGPIDPLTGKKVYVETGRTTAVRRTVTDRTTGKKVKVETGQTRPKKQESKRLAETQDAFSLIVNREPTRMEVIYAEHSNKLKAMANAARKEAVPIKGTPYSPSAKATYSNEVASLNSKLRVAEKTHLMKDKPSSSQIRRSPKNARHIRV